MLNKNERMNKLNNAGVNTDKYFTINLPDGMKDGEELHVIIKNGVPVLANKVNDVIVEQIIEDGYVRNTKLHRRFVMAQMFQGLNYRSYDGKKTGYNEWLKRHGMKYTFDMMLEEVRVLSNIEKADRDTFVERSHFFNQYVITSTMEDYMVKLKKHVESMRTYKCKGIPYKKIKGRDIFVVDIQKKIYAPLESNIHSVRCARSYNEVYKYLACFMRNMVNLPYNTPKSSVWIDAYKGAGAFYTLKNLLMYHNCFLEHKGMHYYGVDAVRLVETKLNEYHNEGWRMFALMKKVIRDNNFDFNKRMAEIYNK